MWLIDQVLGGGGGGGLSLIAALFTKITEIGI